MKNLTSNPQLFERFVPLKGLGHGVSLLAEHDNKFTAVRSLVAAAPIKLNVDNETHTIAISIEPNEAPLEALRVQQGHNSHDIAEINLALGRVCDSSNMVADELRGGLAKLTDKVGLLDIRLTNRIAEHWLKDRAAHDKDVAELWAGIHELKKSVPDTRLIWVSLQRSVKDRAELFRQVSALKWWVRGLLALNVAIMVWSNYKS